MKLLELSATKWLSQGVAAINGRAGTPAWCSVPYAMQVTCGRCATVFATLIAKQSFEKPSSSSHGITALLLPSDSDSKFIPGFFPLLAFKFL